MRVSIHDLQYSVSATTIGLDDDAVHIWHELEHAVCGATNSVHTCGDEDENYVYVKPGDHWCPSCQRSICAFCRLLLGWPV